MDFDFTQEQTMMRDSLSRLFRERYDFDTRQRTTANQPGWRPEIWAQFAELGLLMAPFSIEDGGLGGGPVETMLIMEALGKHLVVEPFIPGIVCAGGCLKYAGNRAQKAEHLEAAMNGTAVFAFAYAEPQGRYALADLQTTAKKTGAGYVLNGHKSVVIGAPWADRLVVTARTGGARRDAGGVSIFVVDKKAKGLTMRPYPTVDGRQAADIYFENTPVGADALIGEEGETLPVIERVADEAVAALCAEAVGIMEIANKMTLDYARQRKQFGVPIGQFQVLQHRMVDMFMEFEQSVSMTYMAVLKLGETVEERQKAVSAARIRLNQASRLIGQEAIQIHGGMGMTHELAIGHYFKRLTMIGSEFGDTGHHMNRYGRLSAA